MTNWTIPTRRSPIISTRNGSRPRTCSSSNMRPIRSRPTAKSSPSTYWFCSSSAGSAFTRPLQLHHLAGPQGAEALGRNTGSLQAVGKRDERRIDRFVGELERAVMVRERQLGAAITIGLHRLRRIHVLVAHEPARLVGADRQDGELERSVMLAGAAKQPAGVVAGIADEVDFSDRRVDHERRP